jgi:hypothetical protein
MKFYAETKTSIYLIDTEVKTEDGTRVSATKIAIKSGMISDVSAGKSHIGDSLVIKNNQIIIYIGSVLIFNTSQLM